MEDIEELDYQQSTDISALITDSAAQISTLCDKVEYIANHIVKARNGQASAIDHEAQQKLLGTITGTFVRLRLLNRQLHEDKTTLNTSVAGLKRKSDSLALDLENKRREVAYIQRDIESTEKLETIYQTIEIIPKEEFLETAPEEFKVDIGTPHKLMLSRLRYEIKQRDALLEEKTSAKAVRDELRKAKRQRVERLEKIDNHLQSYIKSLSLLGRSLGVGSSDETKESSGDGVKVAAGDTESPKNSDKSRESRGEELSRTGTPRI
ncbi:hypothetical protein GGI25_004806 [Coemansia spiralis]|uniref:THO complex subunit 5 n=2 Tax=Coemansia TaxID=4863 RepID=A0A9W8G5W6_9FUNG|nr:hypothetical protein EDC05_004785 [Coemansia umbellata]KAJ2620260.1 hypothetical protein GGI26_005149 [Coemansia sp. RSA 1358]KAJ2673212.1 hypothetical protein GGI25_004806 [Coemansia spiralis]